MKTRSYWITFLLCSGFIPLTVFALRHLTPNSIRISENVDDFKAQIHRVVPKETQVEQARKIMQDNGFSCSLLRGSTYVDGATVAQVEREAEINGQQAFLGCAYQRTLPRAGVWLVRLYYRNQKVIRVKAGFQISKPVEDYFQ